MLASNATPSACTPARNVEACCTFVSAPTQDLQRGTGLQRYSSSDPTVDLGCLDNPGTVGTPQNVKLTGFVRLFSTGNDSTGVKVEVFKEGKDGALGDAVGSYTTSMNDAIEMPKPTWLSKCPDGGCSFRAYSVDNVPTETPLVIRTSDATGGTQWAPLYDYNIYFKNGDVQSGGVTYEASTVAATDLNTVASAAGGFTIRPDKGLLAGEVHDCGDVRLSFATVDTDVQHEGDMFYFSENEADPLPDTGRGHLGTSKLGLFGALNIPTGTPIHISAIGNAGGKTMLLGYHTVQTYPGAVTALSFRGRRPWQQ
ncbi:MAG TPA: hypothetical protein VIF62_06545 [Labilithrix sp.]|jgi:hypothetical protein